MDASAYLARIGYTGDVEPSAETLQALHRAHLFAVPFETVSIHRGERILLDSAWLFDKIVTRRRGGFCYELNGLFAELLEGLGFRVTRLAGRVYNQRGELGIPFDHMALRVEVDGSEWLADVGFGDSFHEPLPFSFDAETTSAGRLFRLTRRGGQAPGDDGVFELSERRDGQPWRAQCRFDSIPRRLADFAAGCDHHQSSPTSPFADRLLCSLPRPDGGRTTLRNLTVLETSATGERSERQLSGADEQRAFLADVFGVRS